MNRLFIVTPARDEIANLPRLASALHAQTHPIAAWFVLENNSTDGTERYVETLTPQGAVERVIVTHKENSATPYAVGTYYAALIAEGLASVREMFHPDKDDFFGIMDADVVPAPDYYAKLIAAFERDKKLGLTSGMTVDAAGKQSLHRKDWVRGSCRVWRMACLQETGYPIAPSADTLTAIKAKLRGWTVRVTEDAQAEAREVGARVNPAYYGYSAYYRGETVLHALLRALKYAAHGQIRQGFSFALGYGKASWSNAPRTEDAEIRAYSRRVLFRFLRG